MKHSKLIFTSLAAAALLSAPIAFAKHHGDKKFEKHDTDGDGKISAAEHIAHATERFNKMDANNDGFVTKEEFKAAKAEKYKKMKDKIKEKMKNHKNNSVE